MGKKNYFSRIAKEIGVLDEARSAKRNERVISSFTADASPRAVIDGKKYLVFNSNDYLGFRFHPVLRRGEEAAQSFGSGPGAVRFISGTLAVHRDLEREIARFHGREDAMLFSSAFAANLGTLSVLGRSAAESGVFIVSDALNHRSIIDGVRLSGATVEQKAIFLHGDIEDLSRVLALGVGKFARAIVVTDGVFSMLGSVQDLRRMQVVVDSFDAQYPEGVLLVVDDCHGIGVLGESGRGAEDVFGVRTDILVGTLGKSLGSDGGYVVGDKLLLEHLRENASTYIYSNPISPGTAGAALSAFKLLNSDEGRKILLRLHEHIGYFKQRALEKNIRLAVDSSHAIQPVLVGDTARAKALADALLEKGILVSPITYPVVPKGADEIRVQITALHTKEDIDELISGIVDFKQT